jgi:hypothetical protein
VLEKGRYHGFAEKKKKKKRRREKCALFTEN